MEGLLRTSRGTDNDVVWIQIELVSQVGVILISLEAILIEDTALQSNCFFCDFAFANEIAERNHEVKLTEVTKRTAHIAKLYLSVVVHRNRGCTFDVTEASPDYAATETVVGLDVLFNAILDSRHTVQHCRTPGTGQSRSRKLDHSPRIRDIVDNCHCFVLLEIIQLR